mgnify:FL=1
MHIMNKNVILAGLAIAVLAGSAWWFTQNSFTHPLPLSEGDKIESWDLDGTYKDGGELEKKANDQIVRLQGFLGGDQSGKDDDPTDYELRVGIANQYELLGDGKRAYEHLGRALVIDSLHTGLAWHNLGALMVKLNALQTARTAYAKAVEAQSGVIQYHIARLEFLTSRFAEDTGAIEGAFQESESTFGDAAPILQIKSAWFTESGRYQEAISAREKMKRLMGGRDADIDREIARLKALP